jgi:YVTN family beta-propeller protein
MVELPSGTVTFLFTDVEGSTRLLKQLRDEYGLVLAEHRRILRAAFSEHGGREMDTQGDAFFVVFARARDAVAAAVAAQRALEAHPWPAGAVCRVRMGLHTGEPSVGDEGYHGMGVHRGARICAAGHGGQILLSNTTRELTEDELPPGVALRDLGEQHLKDIDRPERLYQLVVDGLASEFPLLRTAPHAATERAAGRRPRKALLTGALAIVAAAVAATIVLITGGGSKPAAAAGEISADSVGIFRSDNGRATGQIPVGASPGGVASGFGSLWVSNVDAHSVSRVDPVKGVAIQRIPVGSSPAGIAVGRHFVWVANGLDGTVSQIDPQTDTVVNTIAVGNGPAGVAVGNKYVWVANSDDGTLTKIDGQTGRVLRAGIPVGQSTADGVAVGYGSVWVTSESAGSITRIDAQSGRIVQSVVSGNGANAVAVGHQSVWVVNDLDGTVTRIDPATTTRRATIPVGDGPNGIAVTSTAVWVSNAIAGTLSRIDPAGNTPPRTVKTGNRPEGIVVASNSLFVSVRASGAGHRGGTLTTLTAAGLITTMDPALVYLPAEVQANALTNDGLTGFRRMGGSAGNRLVPDLAVSLPAPTNGGRVYTFQVRPGIRYSTGALVRPQDFRRAIERTLVLPGGFRAYYAGIVGARKCLAAPKKPCDLHRGIVTGRDAKTVTFHLTEADPDFLYELAVPAANAVPAGTPVHVHGALPATGPYKVASFDPKRALRLVRNAHFREWSPAAQPSGFPGVIVEGLRGSPDAHVSAVVRGSADLASNLNGLSASVLASLHTQHASLLEVNPAASTWFLSLTTRIAPFDDVRARQAMNLAIDREHLKDLALGAGLGQVTCQILPSNFDGYRRYCPYTAHPGPGKAWSAPDLTRARNLVRASGTAGETVTVWIPYWTGIGAAAGKYVASVLGSLGYKAHFRLTRKPFDPYAVQDKIRLQVGFYGWFPDFAAPSGFFLQTLTCGSYNRDTSQNTNTAEFCDPAIDREIRRARVLQTTDPEAASQLWAKVDRDVTDRAPWVAFANGVRFEITSARVRNYQYNPQLGTLLDQLWVR